MHWGVKNFISVIFMVLFVWNSYSPFVNILNFTYVHFPTGYPCWWNVFTAIFIKSYASVSVYFLARTLVNLWSGNSLHEVDFQILSTCSLKVNMLSVATVKWSLQNNESHGWFERTFSWDRYWKFVNILWNSLLIISRWCSHLLSWLSCSRSP